MKENIVELNQVSVEYKMKMYHLRAVDNVSLSIKRNAITALVGESGSGKTTLASTILNCLTEPGELVGGHVIFNGQDDTIAVDQLDAQALRKFRWEKVSMVFQGAQSALNPVNTVMEQFRETMKVHRPGISKSDVLKKSREVLDIVNLDADRVLKMYPHELSGGMKQRVMIAFSLLLEPEMIILDEPTTALDVITQDYIFSILKRINQQMHVSMLLLTHDMGIVAKYSDYLGVMYAGRLMEYGTTEDVFAQRAHPYTNQLISATPSLHLPVSAIRSIEGNSPDMLHMPPGCPFASRCAQCMEICADHMPDEYALGENHMAKCHRYSGGCYERYIT